ncbi:MAG: hypothetical protein CL693_13285 [Cellvibrionaceae bacterium]|nr:hypothetical protein [Cellvibrionaceae bacterium]|tara:strand:+ start:293 stop:610 length:318 start_codon:yes stop_codon:yes gene_type:complete
MFTTRFIAILALIPFTLFTLYVVAEVGYVEIFTFQQQGIAGWQVMADLVVALLLVLFWMVPDARKKGRNPWPWVALTLTAGSIGPLLYLAMAPTAQVAFNTAADQ